MEYVEIFKILKYNNLRLTKQKRSIINILYDNNNTFFCVDYIYTIVKKVFPKINISTIYRTLDSFEKAGLVHKMINDEGTSLYKISCCEEHHHHLIFKSCGKIQKIDYCPLTHIREHLSTGFDLTDHKLELFGYCKNCSVNSKNK